MPIPHCYKQRFKLCQQCSYSDTTQQGPPGDLGLALKGNIIITPPGPQSTGSAFGFNFLIIRVRHMTSDQVET